MNALCCRAVYTLSSMALPTAIRMSFDATLIYTGDAQGQLRTWRVPPLAELPSATTASLAAAAASDDASTALQFDESAVLSSVAVPSKGKLGSRISCIRQVPGALAVLNNFGRLALLRTTDANNDNDNDNDNNNNNNNDDDNNNNNAANASTSLRQNGANGNSSSAVDRWQLKAAPIVKSVLRDWDVDALVGDSTFDVSADGKYIVIGKRNCIAVIENLQMFVYCCSQRF